MKAVFGWLLAVTLAVPAFAAAPPMAGGAGFSPIVRVEGGCGRDEHRDRDGYCRPNYREERPICPRGYHLGDDGRKCWPNR